MSLRTYPYLLTCVHGAEATMRIQLRKLGLRIDNTNNGCMYALVYCTPEVAKGIQSANPAWLLRIERKEISGGIIRSQITEYKYGITSECPVGHSV